MPDTIATPEQDTVDRTTIGTPQAPLTQIQKAVQNIGLPNITLSNPTSAPIAPSDEDEPYIHPPNPDLPPPIRPEDPPTDGDNPNDPPGGTGGQDEDSITPGTGGTLPTDANGDPIDLSTASGRSNAALNALSTSLSDPIAFLDQQGATQDFTELNVNNNELMNPDSTQTGFVNAVRNGEAEVTTATTTDASATQADTVAGQTAQDVQVRDFETSLIDPADLTSNFDAIVATDPMVAASMADEMNSLLAGMEDGNVPLWARPAVTKVEQALASRGLSASSIGRDSLFNAIIQSAMPIAQQDATFKQDAAKTNYNAKVQAIFSDTSAANAALQFNATSENQKNQFMTQLQAQVDGQNATRADTMSQFNANADNSANLQFADAENKASQFNANAANTQSQFNAQAANATSQFNVAQSNDLGKFDAGLIQQRNQFNATMATQIEQSNMTWRRQVNQANTAGINAVNQANAQNAFNLSNQAMSFMWQEMRDTAQWQFQASESEHARRNQLEVALLANETAAGNAEGHASSGWLNAVTNITNGLSSLSDIEIDWGFGD